MFGTAVSLSGTTLAAGTLPPIIFPDSGGAFVFERNQGGTNLWGESRKLVPPVAQSGWGAALAVQGDTLIIGSSAQTVSGLNRSGAAFVHRREEGGCNACGQVRQLIPPDSAADGQFGSAVALHGSAIAVSATGSDAGAPDAGALYTWRMGSCELWAGTQPFTSGQDALLSDPDGDGQENLVEFILGSQPLNRASRSFFAHRLTTVSFARYLEGIWTKPFYSTEGADVVLRGSTQTSGYGDYATIISDTPSLKIFRAPQSAAVRPRYFLRMEITYPDTTP